jgi:hypothetical protein
MPESTGRKWEYLLDEMWRTMKIHFLRSFLLNSGAFLVLTLRAFGASNELPLEGIWAAKVGEFGWVALDYQGLRHGQSGPREMWWFVEHVPVIGDFDGSLLKIYYRDQKNEQKEGLRFSLQNGNRLRLEPGGLLPSRLSPPFEDLELQKVPDGQWYALTNNHYKTSEWGKWHEAGALRELPKNWPAALAEVTAHLLSERSSELTRALSVPTLSPDFLAEAYRWTVDKPRWNDQRERIQRVIASNPSCDAATLNELWLLPDVPAVWYAVARNPNAPADCYAKFVERIVNGSGIEQSRLLYEKDIPADLLEMLAEKGSPEAFSNLILAPNITENALLIISRRIKTERIGSPDVWETLMAQPKAPEAFLVEAADMAIKSKHAQMLAALASNSALPVKKRRLVAEARFQATYVDGQPPYSYCVGPLADPYLASEHIHELLDLPLPNVRSELAKNPALTDEQLKRLANDPIEYVSRTAVEAWRKRHPSGPELTLLPGAGKKIGDGGSELREMIFDGRIGVAAGVWLRLPSSQRMWVGQVASWEKGRTPLDPILDFLAAVEPRGGSLAENLLVQLAMSSPENISDMKARGLLEMTRGFSAFQQALMSKKVEVIRVLLDAGLDVNEKGEDGVTPLMLAAATGQIEAVKLLLTYGADVRAKDQNSRTAAEYARLSLNPETLALVAATPGDKAELQKLQAKLSAAPAGSRFVGTWTNHKDGFSTVTLILNRNGSFQFAASLFGLSGSWTTQGSERVVVTPLWPQAERISLDEKQALERSQKQFKEIVFIYAQDPERLLMIKLGSTETGEALTRARQ